MEPAAKPTLQGGSSSESCSGPAYVPLQIVPSADQNVPASKLGELWRKGSLTLVGQKIQVFQLILSSSIFHLKEAPFASTY